MRGWPTPTRLPRCPRCSTTLRPANLAFIALHPGDAPARQPVHTVYGGAHLFRADTAAQARRGRAARARGVRARRRRRSPRAGARARWPSRCTRGSRPSSRASRSRTSASTSRTATATGPTPRRTATSPRPRARWPRGTTAGTLPPFIGIRIKPLTEELRARSLRTLDLFLTTLLRSGGRAAEQLRRHAAQGHDPRAGERARRAARGARARARARRRARCASSS